MEYNTDHVAGALLRSTSKPRTTVAFLVKRIHPKMGKVLGDWKTKNCTVTGCANWKTWQEKPKGSYFEHMSPLSCTRERIELRMRRGWVHVTAQV